MTVMIVIALAVAMAALAFAYVTQRKLADLTQRLARASSNVYQLSSQIEELNEKLESQGKDLRFALQKATGQLNLGPHSTIGEIQNVHPYADQILASFHMGGCHNCAVSPDETISGACARLNVNEAALLAALRNGSPAEPLRLANVELQF